MLSLSSAISRIKAVGIKNKHGTPLGLGHNGDAKAESSSSSELDVHGKPFRKNVSGKKANRKEHHGRDVVAEKQKEEAMRRRKANDEETQQQEPDHIRARYGDLPLVQSAERHFEERSQIKDVSVACIGREIHFRARIHALRKMSANLAFFVFRQQLSTLQGVLHHKDGAITTHMVQWAERIPVDSIVLVKGQIRKPEQTVKGCTIHDVELEISGLHVIARRLESVPFTPYENDVSKEHEEDEDADISHITDRTRLAHRLLDLQTTTSKAIFRVNAGICNLFRSYLDSQGFIEIHTPKLQGGATESGASVFQLDYFGRPAFLAQSPQLAKQMAIAADFERVYEIGPVFRAENSNTHRHLTEYTGLDLEMAIEEHYHEALELIDGTLKHIFSGLYERFGLELQTIKNHFPHEDLVWLKDTPNIPFKQGVQMLIDSGWTDENGKPPSPDEDLHTRDEIRLGQLVKEKYHTDYYILDKFPSSARPFYTMLDPHDSKITNSFDIFVRGQEIISGGQRIHDARMLEEQMHIMGVSPSSMQDYMDGFKYGAPPHAGAGIGLERLLMLILRLGNIRLGSLFPRDPKSLPAQPPPPALRHLGDSTLHPPWDPANLPDEEHMQPLENLIANYGDSTNTSWTDDRYKIWRHKQTGAAVSYVPTNGYAILPGNPLCDPSQYTDVAATFLRWLKKETHLKPIWVLVGYEMEEVLGTRFGWKTLTCVAEERVDATKEDAQNDRDVARKVRHAEKEGVRIIDIAEGETVPDDVKQECDERIREWLANRNGKQIHLSEITPWRDMAHRRYFYAQDKNGRICALVVLAQLAPRHGYQVKWSLDFPDAPSGTIEYIILHAIQAAKASGTKILTFGSAATSELRAVHHLSSTRVKMLQHTYQTIAKQFKLAQKGDFRQKLGGEEDPVYICYPPRGLGVTGSRAVVQFFESDN
ncbi:MAG: hypothetical protein Q9217_005555 [Psora testacea]